jgi:hypothetical protein
MTPARLRSRPLRASFLCLAVAIGSLGCSLELGSAPPPAVDASIPPEIREAISVRQEFGLRSDEAWVRAVAANPDAVMDFGIPMLPFE